MDTEMAKYLGDIKESIGALKGSQDAHTTAITREMAQFRQDVNERLKPLEKERKTRRRDDWISSIISVLVAYALSWLGLRPNG